MGNPDQPHKPSESLVKIPAPVHTVFFIELIKAFCIDMATAKAARTETFMVGRFAPHHKCPKQTGDSYISALLNPGMNLCGGGWQRGSHIQKIIPKSSNADISAKAIASRFFPIKSHLAGRAL